MKERPTLLLIADNPSIWHWIKKNLENEFYLIYANYQNDAVEQAKSTKLDFIVLDSRFEECDALALARELRRANLAVPILLITGNLKKSFRDEAVQSGVSDFLNEELAIEEMKARIAVGEKTAMVRKKTNQISAKIKAPPPPPPHVFKHKAVLNGQAIALLSNAKEEPIALLLIRIDHYAGIGEAIAAPLSERLQQSLRTGDVLIPSSEGLFIALLPRTPIEEARTIAETLRRAIPKEPFQLPDRRCHATISIVISPLRASEEQYRRVVKNAKEALDQAQTTTNLIISLEAK